MMAATSYHRTDTPQLDLERALKALAVTERERAELRGLIGSFEPGHGLRMIFAKDLPALIARECPQGLATYSAFDQLFPKRNLFAIMPLGEVVLRMVCGAKLVSPLKPLWEGLYWLMRLTVRGALDNPAMQIAKRAANGDLRMFLELTMTGDDKFGNYIKHRVLRELGPRHLEIESEGGYTQLDRILSIPYMESIFALFGVEGEAELEALGQRASVLKVRWR